MLAGRLAADTGRYADADQMFSSAVQQLEEARIEGGLIARPLYELAAVRAFTGRHADASRLLTRAIAILEASPKPDPSELAVGWLGLGKAYLNIGKYSNAAQAFQKALDLKQGRRDAPTPVLIAILVGLSSTYRAQHSYGDAEATLKRAQTMLDKSPGADPWIHVFLLTGLGNLYLWEHRLAEAAAVLRQGQAVVERAATPDQNTVVFNNAAVGYLSYNLAMVCFGQKQYRESERLFAKALVMAESGAPMPPDDVVRILWGYARCLRKVGNKDYARNAEARAKAILATAPPDSRDVLVDVSTLMRSK
jgi:tetratricopeptide (TPR) repeat protein